MERRRQSLVEQAHVQLGQLGLDIPENVLVEGAKRHSEIESIIVWAMDVENRSSSARQRLAGDLNVTISDEDLLEGALVCSTVDALVTWYLDKQHQVSSSTSTWVQCLADDGEAYYWNAETNDTTWEPSAGAAVAVWAYHDGDDFVDFEPALQPSLENAFRKHAPKLVLTEEARPAPAEDEPASQTSATPAQLEAIAIVRGPGERAKKKTAVSRIRGLSRADVMLAWRAIDANAPLPWGASAGASTTGATEGGSAASRSSAVGCGHEIIFDADPMYERRADGTTRIIRRTVSRYGLPQTVRPPAQPVATPPAPTVALPRDGPGAVTSPEPVRPSEPQSSGSGVKLEDHPEYSKYFKLLRVGVPRGGLESKMRAEGLDPAALDCDPSEPLPQHIVTPSDVKPETPSPPKPVDKTPPFGCNRVPHDKLRRVFWDVVDSPEGTMWGKDTMAEMARLGVHGEPPNGAVLFLSSQALEELESFFKKTSPRPFVSAADARKNKKDVSQATHQENGASQDAVASNKGRALVAEALGEKRAFALNLLYGSLRMANEECVSAVATLDPDNSVFVSKLPRLETLRDMISSEEEIAAIEAKAIAAGILDAETKSIRRGGSIESSNLDSLSSLIVSLIDRARRPRAKVRALWLYATVGDRASELMASIRHLKTAAEAIRASDSLKKLFCVVLSITNFVNHGSEHGNKRGVRLGALAKLQTTKTTMTETSCKNLLQLVVRHAGVPAADLQKEIPQRVLRNVRPGATRSAISHGITQLRTERNESIAERGVLSREALTSDVDVDSRRMAFSAMAFTRMANLVADVDDELAGLDASFSAMASTVDDALKYYGEPLDGSDAVDWFRTLETFIGLYDAEYSEWLDQLARRERQEELARKKLAREMHDPVSDDKLQIICAECKTCNASTTPGAYTSDPDHSWYCKNCWLAFSFEHTDDEVADTLGERTVPD